MRMNIMTLKRSKPLLFAAAATLSLVLSAPLSADMGDNSVGICIHIPPRDVLDACVELDRKCVV